MSQYPQTATAANPTLGALLPDDYLKYLPVSNPGMVAIVRFSDMKVFFINQQFTHYLGYTNQDLHEGLYFNKMLANMQEEHLVNQLKHTTTDIEARSTFVIYRLRNKDGNVIPFYLYTSPFMAEGQQHEQLHFLLMLPDLSRQGMPFTSFHSKELFLEQFKSENFGTYEWIMEVNKIFCSAGVYRIYETEELNQGITTFFATEFIHPSDKVRVKESTRYALESGQDLNIEYRIITAKGNVKLIHCLARSIRDNSGKVTKFAGSIRDITVQRSIEQTLKNKVEELNHSNRELEEFAYVASHDMQEPLRKITTFSDRLAEKYKGVLTGEGAMYLSRMIASAENMRALINDLLEFSRISKTEQSFESVNLNLILRQVKTDLELTIEETGTVINAPQLPVIDAIGSQMKQLFSNIIGNAIKFRKAGVKPVIDIAVNDLAEKDKLRYELYPNVPYYEITITDNGIGFEDEYATRIFQVFQRLHGKSEYPGSGIGLAICKKILEHHHGSIYATNVPGQGARFVFILPQQQQKG